LYDLDENIDFLGYNAGREIKGEHVMRSTSRPLAILFAVLVVLCGVIAGAKAAAPAPEKASASTAVQLKKADQFISVERLEDALAILKAIEPETSNISAKVDVLLGKIYQRLHRPGKAADLFEGAVFSSMDDADAYLGMAETSLALGKLTQARQHASTAIKSNPDLIGAHLVLARVDDRTGQTAKAKERFFNLIKNQPDSEPVIEAYGQFLSQREDVDAAIRVLSKYVNRHPYAAEAGDLLGQLYWQQGRRVEALQTRTNAAKAFQAKGNEFRADAIRSWLSGSDPGGQYLQQLTPGKKPESITDPVPENTPEQPKATEPAPAPSSVPVPEVKEAKLPNVPRPSPKTPQVLKRPEPLPLPEGVMLSTGSGFIIDGGRYVITNRHVIDKTGKIAVRTGTGEVRTARVKEIAKDDDLALLELSEPFPSSYAITTNQMGDGNTGRSAVVMGYPMAGIIGWQQPSLTEGIVSKASGFKDNPTTFLITSKMNKGNSGGPIFDRQGRLIGIAVAKLDTTKIYEKKGNLPEDVNIGIKASRLLSFLNRTGNGNNQSPSPEVSLEELYQMMLAKVVLIAAVAK